MHCRLWLISLFLLVFTAAHAQPPVRVLSPSGRLELQVQRTSNGTLHYSLRFDQKPVLEPSALGFVLQKPALRLDTFSWAGMDTSSYDAWWKPVWGEVSQIRDRYRQLTLRLRSTSGIAVHIIFRVFDEGLGFRYYFPEQEGFRHFVVADERTQFNLAGDHKAFWIPGDYDTNEYLYNTTPLSAIAATKAAAKEKDIALKTVIGPNTVQTPLMMKTRDPLYINIHEAALLNYPVMHLTLDKKTFTFVTQLTPDAVGNKAYLQTPFATPWRTIHVSDKAEAILASKMILNLNEPSRMEDPSWIRPQKFLGMWWEMHVGKSTWQKEGGKHGARTENVRQYIDFAAEHGFDGVLVEGWNEGWEDWFGNWKEDVFDFVTPYSDYDVEGLSAYARQKGISLIMHHETSGSVTNYERHLDTAFAFMQRHGMHTVKTGYVGRIIPRGEHHDGQWMVKHYERVAKKAAEKRIMVEAHEPAHPTGLHRTYPNWLANEAARGNEFNNAPTLGLVPEHETILPFTRLMGGPMDYTPGFFQFALNQYEPDRKQRVRTTLAKQLALYVTIYSPLQMAGDFPENYRKYPDAFQFIRDVPVDWDDTQVLAAEPGDYITIARKKKGSTDWFLGAITDEESRNQKITLGFLDPGARYEATRYMDSPDAHWKDKPEGYVIDKVIVDQQTVLNIRLAPGGGTAIRFRKL